VDREDTVPGGTTVTVRFEEGGIAWVILDRPEKRNAMNPTLNREMVEVLEALEGDDRARVLVLTGAGPAFCAGMDLKEYFREVDAAPPHVQVQARRYSMEWQWRRLIRYPKPTIAMVNGWCFGGAFTPLVCCDLAIAAEDAVFGLSEVNWGIPPGGLVPRALAEVIPTRDAMYYIMTGETFDGRRAAEMRLVNEAVPPEQLRERTLALARKLAAMNPAVLYGAKVGYRTARQLSWDEAEDYVYAKLDQAVLTDPEDGRAQGLSQFLDAKTLRPGLGAYDRGEGGNGGPPDGSHGGEPVTQDASRP
jgi:trans-feruloyl-CoA hydratase/vanillin synthase